MIKITAKIWIVHLIFLTLCKTTKTTKNLRNDYFADLYAENLLSIMYESCVLKRLYSKKGVGMREK